MIRQLALLFLLMPVPLTAAAREEGILDFYHELQVAQPIGFPSYGIAAPKAGAAASDGWRQGGQIEVVLDLPRDYLRITDHGDGDPAEAMVTEMATWIDQEGAPLVALSERVERDGRPVAGRLRFYSRATERWNLVTAQVWPAGFAQALCRTEAPDVPEEVAGRDRLGAWVALLPRAGIDIEAWCVGSSPVAGTGAVATWDGRSGIFTRGAVLQEPPPWAPSGK